MFRMFRFLPLMALLLLCYNGLVWTAGPTGAPLSRVLFTINLPSDVVWPMNVSYFLICIGLLTLFIEFVKSSRASPQAMIEQSLSTIVFLVYLVQFLVWAPCGESTFFVLVVIAFVETLGGFIIMTRVAARDISIS